jgi:hypothetical protein
MKPPRYVLGTTPDCLVEYGGRTNLRFASLDALGTTSEHFAEFSTPSRASQPSPLGKPQTYSIPSHEQLPSALLPLTKLSNWVLWRWVKTADGRWSKEPYRVNDPDTHAETNAPKTWSNYEDACRAVECKHADGIGFCLLNTDISAIDLDHCRDSDTKAVAPWADMLLGKAYRLGAYVEVTVSGTGFRIIGKGSKREIHRSFKLPEQGPDAKIEFYRNTARYITISGLQNTSYHPHVLPNIDALFNKELAFYDDNKGGNTTFDFVPSDNVVDLNGNPFLAYAFSLRWNEELENLVEHGAPVGQRSDKFHYVVCELLDHHWSCDEILTLLRRHPNGIAEKYIKRLPWAVNYSVKRWEPNKRSEQDESSDNVTTPKPRLAIPAFSNDWCDVSKIPRRRWLYEQHYVRGFVTASIAPGGVGKSTKAIIDGICMASTRALLGVPVTEQVKVWYWNGEEPRHEIARRVHAVCEHYNIDPHSIADTFHFTSGLDQFPIKIVTATKKGITVNEALVADVVDFIQANDIGVMIIDPLISSHAVPENDNVAMDMVVKTWGRIAAQTDCDAELVHHTRKALRGEDSETLASDARGAGSLIDGVRASRVFNQMTEKEAGDFGVDDRSQYFRVNRGKTNMVIRGNPTWFKLVSVVICNGDPTNPQDGDNVQTVAAWTPPGAFDSVTTAHMHAVRARAAKGTYRLDARTTGDPWIGEVIAEVAKLDGEKQRSLIESIVKTWLKMGVLKRVQRKDANYRLRWFVEPGEWTE